MYNKEDFLSSIEIDGGCEEAYTTSKVGNITIDTCYNFYYSEAFDIYLKFFDGTSKKIFIREAEDGSFSFEITDELLSEFSKLLKVEVEEGREILYSLLMATTEMLPYSVSKEELEEVKKYSIY